MAWVSRFLMAIHYMKVSLLMVNVTVLGEQLVQKVKCTKANLIMIRCMDKGILYGLMVVYMKEIGLRIKRMARVNISGRMVRFMMVNLKMMIVTVMAFCIIQMGSALKEIGERVKNMEAEHIYSQIEHNSTSSTDMVQK